MSDREMVLFANAAFYAAFAARDIPAMERLWAEGTLMCVHPGWPPLADRESVIASWRNIMGNTNAPDISCRQANVVVLGSTAVVTCIEIIKSGGEPQQALSATNVFVKPAGSKEWRIVHHHAGAAQVDPRTVKDDEDTGPVN